MKIQMATEVGPFDGTPRAEQLLAALALLPGEAFVTVESWDSQRDGSGWRIKARWAEER